MEVEFGEEGNEVEEEEEEEEEEVRRCRLLMFRSVTGYVAPRKRKWHFRGLVSAFLSNRTYQEAGRQFKADGWTEWAGLYMCCDLRCPAGIW